MPLHTPVSGWRVSTAALACTLVMGDSLKIEFLHYTSVLLITKKYTLVFFLCYSYMFVVVFFSQGKLQKMNNSVYQTDYIRDIAIEFLQRTKLRTKPFFLYLSPFAPHAPATVRASVHLQC